MTINGINKYVDGVKVDINDLKQLRDVYEVKSIAIDNSYMMHELIGGSTPDATDFQDDFHQQPPVDLSQFVFNKYSTLKKNFDKHGFKMILVFDGLRNPLKSAVDASRLAPHVAAAAELKVVMESKDVTRLGEAGKLKKRPVTLEMTLSALLSNGPRFLGWKSCALQSRRMGNLSNYRMQEPLMHC